MASITEQIQAQFNTVLQKKLNAQVLRRISDAIGKLLVRQNQDRILEGIDKNGRAFKGVSEKYKKQKLRFIKGLVKWGSRGGKKPSIGVFAAKQVGDAMRLTGNLFDDIDYNSKPATQPTVGVVKFNVEVYVLPRSAGKAKGLIKSGRPFLGLATGVRGLQERNQIGATIRRELAASGTVAVK